LLKRRVIRDKHGDMQEKEGEKEASMDICRRRRVRKRQAWKHAGVGM